MGATSESRSGTLHRLFYALRPPPELAGRIGRLRDGIAGLRSGVADARLHITLGLSADFADFPDAVATEMIAIGEATHAAPTEITLDRLAAMPGWIGLRPSRRSDPLHALANALGADLARAGLGRAGWRFNPHVTLGHGRHVPGTAEIEAIAWRAECFVLVHSLVGETRHLELGRWPLATRQEELPL